MKRIATALALCWALFQVWIWWDKELDLVFVRSAHLCFAMATGAAVTAARSKRLYERIVLLAAAALSFVPPVFHYLGHDRWLSRISGLDPVYTSDLVVCAILFATLGLLGWRLVGKGMIFVVAVFVAYQLLGGGLPGELGHRQAGLSDFVDQQLLTMEGLYGIPLGISVSVVFYFILFAAVFELFGGGRMIVDLALAMTGRYRGGPAKAAVVGSALTGLVSGSAVANVMSSGIFSIPLMKRAGYKPTFAAAVEAVVSTAGQIMPPVMGAAAFIMADMLRIPYTQIITAAALPALLYFTSVFITVDFTARRDALPLLPSSELTPAGQVLRDHGHMLAPLAWLAWRIVSGYSVSSACLEGIAATIIIGSLRANTRQKPRDILLSFATGAQRAVTVAIPCALAGVIVGVVAFTGLGTKFTGMIVDLSHGSVVLAVLLTIAAAIVLGFGMPTTSAYVMSAILLAPAMVSIGFAPIATHMLLLYFAVLAMVTPPIALAAYAAAGIAEAPSSKTGWVAFGLSIPVMLIPVMFLYRSELLMVGSVPAIIGAVAITLLALVASSGAATGWLIVRHKMPVRLALAVSAILMVLPRDVVSFWMFGVAIIAAIALWSRCVLKTRSVKVDAGYTSGHI
ncbi:TRAP transporter fused permease subunit [Martelella sp. FLE1502]